jgi:uncharacterized membrane protein
MATTAGRFPTTALLLSTPEEVAAQARGEVSRVARIAGGGLLALYGLWRGGTFGLLTAGAGALLIAGADRGKVRAFDKRWHGARAAVTILAEPQALYHHWRGLWTLPSLVSVVSGVEPRPNGELRLFLHDGDGRQLSLDVEIEVEIPGELIRWKAVPTSDVPGEGEVYFRPAPGGRGTEVHVRILLGPPAGFVGAVAAGLVGRSGEPGRALADDLRRFKQRVETGEVATTQGQPRGSGARTLRRITARVLPEALLADPVAREGA